MCRLLTNTVEQTSLPIAYSPLISIPSLLSEINNQSDSGGIASETPLFNNISSLEDLNISQNNQTLTNIADFDTGLDIKQLNFEQIYAQYHCMDPQPMQLTPQQYQEMVIDNNNHTPAIKNILYEFFTKTPNLVKHNKVNKRL
eukprot:33955_1